MSRTAPDGAPGPGGPRLCILFLNSYPAWGGGETWMLDLAGGLKSRGHRCLIAGTGGRPWFERSRALGWNPIELNLRGEFAPLVYPRLRRLYARAPVDLVVCNFDKEVRIAGIARWGRRRPIIVNLKGLLLISDNWRYRFSYRHFVDHTVVNARFIREAFLRRAWIDPAGVSVIYTCFRPGPAAVGASPGLDFRRECGIPEDHPVVGAVARFDWRKGVQDLIAAAPAIVAAHPDAYFVIVGDGSLRNRLVEQARDAGLGDRVVFTGFRHDLDVIVPAFDVFVLPSHDEGFPYVIQIAMHHGKAIVATRVGAVEDAIADSVNGLLVDPEDPPQLARSVNRLLDDPALRRRLGAEAAETLKARFSFEGMIDRFESLFLKLTGAGPSKLGAGPAG